MGKLVTKSKRPADEANSSNGDQPKPWIVTFLMGRAHFWAWVFKSFLQNRCPVRASALAYTTLLALIPVLAIVLSVSASLLKDKGEEQINQIINKFVAKVAFQLDLVPPEKKVEVAAAMSAKTNDVSGVSTNAVTTSDNAQAEAAAAALNPETKEKTREVAQRIHDYIQRVRTKTIGAAAAVGLIFVGISLLSTIEVAFNDIWGAAQGRSWLSRVINYWAAITLGPIFIVLLLGLKNMTLLQKVPALGHTLKFFEDFPVTGWMIENVLPFALMVLTFATFYQLMPNTKVRWRPALAGALAAAALWNINSHLNFVYVSQVVRNTEIYGGLGAVPIFLISLYFAWIIVLFGAQVAYAVQNRRAHLLQKEAENVNQRGKEFIALRIMTFVAHRFQKGDRPPTLSEISEALGVPSQLVCRVISPMEETRLLVEAKGGEEVAYAPGRPLDRISYEDILNALRVGNGEDVATKEDALRDQVRGEFERIHAAQRDVAGKITLQEMVDSGSTGFYEPADSSRPQTAF